MFEDTCFTLQHMVWGCLGFFMWGACSYWFFHRCNIFLHSDVNYCSATEEQNNSFVVNWNWYPWFQVLKSQIFSSLAERQPLSWLLECALCSLNAENMKRELKSSVSLHPWRLDSLTLNLILGDQSATWEKCEKKQLFHNILLK